MHPLSLSLSPPLFLPLCASAYMSVCLSLSFSFSVTISVSYTVYIAKFLFYPYWIFWPLLTLLITKFFSHILKLSLASILQHSSGFDHIYWTEISPLLSTILLPLLLL